MSNRQQTWRPRGTATHTGIAATPMGSRIQVPGRYPPYLGVAGNPTKVEPVAAGRRRIPGGKPVFLGFDRGSAGPRGVDRGIYALSKFVSWLVRGCLHYMLHYISTTCSGSVHYMAGNDYRRGRRQVSMVVDDALWLAVKANAAAKGVSVTRFVTDLLETAVQPEPAVPDWDAILRPKQHPVVEPDSRGVGADPLLEIA